MGLLDQNGVICSNTELATAYLDAKHVLILVVKII
jgi:hypothetical protein